MAIPLSTSTFPFHCSLVVSKSLSVAEYFKGACCLCSWMESAFGSRHHKQADLSRNPVILLEEDDLFEIIPEHVACLRILKVIAKAFIHVAMASVCSVWVLLLLPFL